MTAFDIFTMRSEVRDALGVDATDLDNPATDLLLNRALWDILNKLDFKVEDKRTSLSTVAATRTVAFAGDQIESIRNISILDPNSQLVTSLKKVAVKEYENMRDEDPLNEGQPEYYYLEGTDIFLHPVPDAVYTLTVISEQTVADLNDTTELTSTLPKEVDEIITLGAIWRGFLKFGDIQRMAMVKSGYNDMIRALKLRIDKDNFANNELVGLEVILPNYP